MAGDGGAREAEAGGDQVRGKLAKALPEEHLAAVA